MSKRFIDTELFNDPWFMDLSKDGKLLWIYLITRCDHAGLLELNIKLCKTQTDIKDIEFSLKELANRLVRVTELLIFIPKFINFQYPGFPNSNVRQQQSAIDKLLKYDLLNSEDLTVRKDLVKSYGSGNDNGSGIEEKKKVIIKTWKNDYETYLEVSRSAYKLLIEDAEYIKKLQEFHPKLNIKKSIEKSFVSYWGTKEGWINKKTGKTIDIDWNSTIMKNITKSAVYNDGTTEKTTSPYKDRSNEY